MTGVGAGETIWTAFCRRAARHPTAVALVDGQRRVTYAEVVAAASRLSLTLADAGLLPGDSALVVAGNRPVYVETLLAILRLGAVAIPVDPLSSDTELGSLTNDSRPRLVVMERALTLPPVNALPGIQRVFAELGTQVFPADDQVPAASRSYPSRQAPDLTSGPGDPAMVFYTSGTSGPPKGVVHTHTSLLSAVSALDGPIRMLLARGTVEGARSAGRLVRSLRGHVRDVFKTQQVWLTPLPLRAIGGNAVLLQTLLQGHRLVLVDDYEPRRVLAAAAEQCVNILVLTPTMAELLLHLPEAVIDEHDLSSLLIIGLGGSRPAADLVQCLECRLGCTVVVGYGSTELGGGIMAGSMADSARDRAETVGRPFGGTEIRIVDEDRNSLPPGRVGELACRVNSLMAGYQDDPARTRRSVDRDGWYYTGDLATVDERGWVRIVDRKSDLIIRGGQNIWPHEVESAVESHPHVRRAAVVGVPDDVVGERVWAFLLAEPGTEPDLRDVARLCRSMLAPYKVPERFRVLAELPLTDDGAVRKFLLREAALHEGSDRRFKAAERR